MVAERVGGLEQQVVEVQRVVGGQKLLVLRVHTRHGAA
jgi:hypothetical protein